MTEPFLGEIQLFGFSYPPAGWASCNGATLMIRQNTALFSLLGPQYGGDGVNTFQLPNFMNRAADSQGPGPGLDNRTMGEDFGTNAVTLTLDTMPAHNHQLVVYATRASTAKVGTPVAGAALTPPGQSHAYVPNVGPTTTLSPTVLAPSGGNGPHENRQPFLAVNYSMALQGAFPSFG
ncbi:MAG: phage tail protein [Brevundimonas sp.]|nr:MAG: phage tail protein [Brevundimonas sp.]